MNYGIGFRFRRARKDRGLWVRQIAKICGVAPDIIWQLERKGTVDEQLCKTISIILDVSLDWLKYGVDSIHNQYKPCSVKSKSMCGILSVYASV